MTPKTAASLLSLSLNGPWTVAAVRQAFSAAVRQAHPDTGGGGGIDMAKLKKARDVLLKEAQSIENIIPCTKCDGTGQMKTPRGRRVTCVVCGGSGEVRKNHG